MSHFRLRGFLIITSGSQKNWFCESAVGIEGLIEKRVAALTAHTMAVAIPIFYKRLMAQISAATAERMIQDAVRTTMGAGQWSAGGFAMSVQPSREMLDMAKVATKATATAVRTTVDAFAAMPGGGKALFCGDTSEKGVSAAAARTLCIRYADTTAIAQISVAASDGSLVFVEAVEGSAKGARPRVRAFAREPTKAALALEAAIGGLSGSDAE
jgi:hypothetical protein